MGDATPAALDTPRLIRRDFTEMDSPHQPPPGEPQRRPLRVRLAGQSPARDGTPVPTEGYVMVPAGDPDDEADDQRASHARRQHGTPLPYAEEPPTAEGEETEP